MLEPEMTILLLNKLGDVAVWRNLSGEWTCEPLRETDSEVIQSADTLQEAVRDAYIAAFELEKK